MASELLIANASSGRRSIGKLIAPETLRRVAATAVGARDSKAFSSLLERDSTRSPSAMHLSQILAVGGQPAFAALVTGYLHLCDAK